MKIREIRTFREEEYKAVLNLLPRLGAHVKLPSEEDFRKILESETSHLFLLEAESGEIAGMLSIGKYFVPTGMKVWIEDVDVYKRQLLNYIFLKLFVEYVGLDAVLSKVLTTVIVVIFSYVSQRYFSFKTAAVSKQTRS